MGEVVAARYVAGGCTASRHAYMQPWVLGFNSLEARPHMQAVEIQSHARKMLEAHGSQAIVEATRKAKTCERAGD